MAAAQVALGLGSSLGDRRGNLAVALHRLDATPGLRVSRVSRLYRSLPMGGVARGWFLNAVAVLSCELEPQDLLPVLKDQERRLGRRPGPRWGDRVLDLDLLLVEDRVLDLEGLVVPHPGIGTRSFVLLPLLEVLPGARDPRTGRPWRDLAPGPPPLPTAWGVLACGSAGTRLRE